MTIKEVTADGNCLYGALVDQLYLQKRSVPKEWLSVSGLRRIAAEHIRRHSEEYVSFVLAADTGESGDTAGADIIGTYCEKLEKTAAWGGQVELRALSESMRSTIVIHCALTPEVIMGQDYGDPEPLRLSFHKHYYALGEHYNSVVPIATTADNNDE